MVGCYYAGFCISYYKVVGLVDLTVCWFCLVGLIVWVLVVGFVMLVC